MAIALNPYLNFPGTTREAMTFYQSVLGGELQISTFGDFGAQGPEANGVMHSHLETEAGMTFMASDMPPGQEDSYVAGNTITMSISASESSPESFMGRPLSGRSRPKVVVAISRILAVMASSTAFVCRLLQLS